jgi:hypothetical protein
MTIRTIILSAALAFGLATAANAGITPTLVGNVDSLVVKVAQGCGSGWTRGPYGRCHPMGRNGVRSDTSTSPSNRQPSEKTPKR